MAGREQTSEPGKRLMLRTNRRETVVRKVLVVLLVLVVLAVGVGGGLGFYLGWFDLATSRNPETGQTGVELNIDQKKMKEDVQKAKEKVGGEDQKAKDQPKAQ
jgi:hypothetical protein